jgi:Zn finger protein HypA/HybF involved in hydrogenase expression
MNNLEENNQEIDYNEEPVFYCEHCLSLCIRHIPVLEDSEYCDKCGSTNVSSTTIEDWELKYKERYGYTFLEEY